VALSGWVLDKSAAARAGTEPVSTQLAALAGSLFICPIGELEQLYSARSARDYDVLKASLRTDLDLVEAPADLLGRALRLQQDLAHHHGMWHRTPIPDLLIAAAAEGLDLGVLHYDGDFDLIAAVTGQKCSWVVPAGSVE